MAWYANYHIIVVFHYIFAYLIDFIERVHRLVTELEGPVHCYVFVINHLLSLSAIYILSCKDDGYHCYTTLSAMDAWKEIHNEKSEL